MRVVQPIRAGDEITESMVQIVEVGGYNLPEDVLRQKESAVGKYATADLAVGDYIIPSKLSDAPAAENAYLYSLDGSQQAISVSIKSFAEGLSGKLQSGDIVSVIAPDYKQQGQTVVPAELQYVEIISVTASSGYDANTGEPVDEEDDKELPDTVTLLVSPEQAKVLAELEAEGTIHLALVYRGDRENADKFLTSQDEDHSGIVSPEPDPRRNHRRIPQSPNPPLTPAKPQKRRRPRKPRRWPDAELQESGYFSRGSGQEDACEQEDQSGGCWRCGQPRQRQDHRGRAAGQISGRQAPECDPPSLRHDSPNASCICPAADLECERSLGSVLAAAHVSENLVKNNLVTHKRLGYLTMLGMLKGENEYTYPPYNEVQARESIDCLREIAPSMWSLTAAVTSPTTSSPLWRSWRQIPSCGWPTPTSRASATCPANFPPAGCQMGYGQAVQDRQQCKVPAGRGSHESGAGDSGLHAAPFGGAGGTVSGRQPAGGPIHEGQPRYSRKEIEKIAREVFGC